MTRVFLYVLKNYFIVSVTKGLKLKELTVPKHANLGDAARLGCYFDAEDAGLYSVKWYKDENEFFRFMPDNAPQTQVFPLAGITLDVRIQTEVIIIFN